MKRANRFKAKLRLVAENLADGVTAPAVDVPEKDGEVALKITADATAKPSGQPFTIILRETDSDTVHTARFFMTTTGENNGVPQGYTELVIPSTGQLWLTVFSAPAKPDVAKPDVPK